MKHISILLLHQVNVGSMENARQGLLEANRFMSTNGRPPLFQIDLVGSAKEVELQNGQIKIRGDRTLGEVKRTDLIIIPPVTGDIGVSLELNKDFLPWICEHRKVGAEIVSLCLGAFILGATGLLDGKKCVTHWKATLAFKQLFPKAKLEPDKLLTDEQGIYTGGGAFSSANLILYLIEKMAGRDASLYCSKVFQVDMGRTSQSPFIMFTGQKEHSDDLIRSVQEYVEKHFSDHIQVDELSERFNLVRRTLERRFKQATGNTLIEYMQRVRVEVAKRDLEKTRKTVSEIMYEVGYSDAKSFRVVFKRHSGLSPTEYKSKYRNLIEQNPLSA